MLLNQIWSPLHWLTLICLGSNNTVVKKKLLWPQRLPRGSDKKTTTVHQNNFFPACFIQFKRWWGLHWSLLVLFCFFILQPQLQESRVVLLNRNENSMKSFTNEQCVLTVFILKCSQAHIVILFVQSRVSQCVEPQPILACGCLSNRDTSL